DSPAPACSSAEPVVSEALGGRLLPRGAGALVQDGSPPRCARSCGLLLRRHSPAGRLSCCARSSSTVAPLWCGAAVVAVADLLTAGVADRRQCLPAVGLVLQPCTRRSCSGLRSCSHASPRPDREPILPARKVIPSAGHLPRFEDSLVQTLIRPQPDPSG